MLFEQNLYDYGIIISLVISPMLRVGIGLE